MKVLIGALIFDVDGTLAETEELHRRSYNAAFAECDLARHLPDGVRGWDWDRATYRRLLWTTGGKERLAAYVREDLGIDPAAHAELLANVYAAKTRAYGRLMAAEPAPLRAGIADILVKAREAGLALAVASTTNPLNLDALTRAALGRPAAQVFDAIAAGDDAARKKPAPDVYLLALERLGLPATSALALEDSRNGLMAAKAAGLACLVSPALYTAGEDLSEADAVVEEFSWPAVAALAR